MNIALLALSLVGCTVAQRIVNTTGLVVGVTATYCDYRETQWASREGTWPDPGYREHNPLLGSTPSQTTLQLAAAGGALAFVAMYVAPMPRWLRTSLLTVTAAAEATVAFRMNTARPCALNKQPLGNP